MAKWVSLIGSTLRTRNLNYQIKLTEEFAEYSLDKFKAGKFKPVIDKIYDWKDVAEAHAAGRLERGLVAGKLVLKID